MCWVEHPAPLHTSPAIVVTIDSRNNRDSRDSDE
jgi:hypothetical protein